MNKLFHKKTYVMGTQIDLKILSKKSSVESNTILEEGINIFHSIAKRFSRFSKSNELAILNNSNGKYISVSEDLLNLIEFGIKLGNETNEIFDITILDLLEAYGFDQHYKIEKKIDYKLRKKLKSILAKKASFRDIKLNKKKLKIKLAPRQKIDLGSIGKGYAINKVKKFFFKKNISNFCISAGGDVYAHGQNKNKPWKALLFDPIASLKTKKLKSYQIINIKNQSIACSGIWGRKTGKFHHLLNPKKGLPVKQSKNKNLQVPIFVKGKNPLFTDALATIAFIDLDIAKNICSNYDCTILKQGKFKDQ